MTRCYELDGVDRFSPRAGLYASSRPSYPVAAIVMILDGLPEPAGLHLVDIGAGTGISTRLLIDQGVRAVAADPNMDMLLAAVGTGDLRVRALVENLPFASHSLDVVTSFNSFHWFKPALALPEIVRVLRDGGRLAVVWNDWDYRDEFTAEFVKLMRRSAGDLPPEDREGEVAPLYGFPGIRDLRRTDFENRHRLDLAGLTGRLQSMSYVPIVGALAESLVRELGHLHRRFADSAGIVTHHYITCVFIGTRA